MKAYEWMTTCISLHPQHSKIMAIDDTYQKGSWWCKAMKEWFDGRKRWYVWGDNIVAYKRTVGGRGYYIDHKEW